MDSVKTLKESSKKRLWAVYLGGFLLAVHYATVAYINSSLLKEFVGDSTLNILYVTGSILSIISLSLAPFLLRKYGNILTFLIFIALESFAVFGMGSFRAAVLVIILFLIHQAAESMLYFCLDVNLEKETKNENTTGSKRGAFLTIQNVAWVLSPLAITFLVKADDFSNVYFLSGAALILLFIITAIFFKNTKKVDLVGSNIIGSLHSILKGGDRAKIIGTQFVLQFYFSWMVIYLPLLLIKEVGFDWDKVGLIFTIMLIPYLIFELPAGLLGDKKMGEKEILITGFIIMFLSTLAIPNIGTKTFWLWAIVLFGTRIGAALVEISSESYFFKHVKEEDTALISLFRMARPLSSVIAPLIAIPVIYFFSYSSSFYFLSILSLFGLFFLPKVDTK